MDYSDYSESQNRLSLNIPIMFGTQINQFYFLAGAKAGINLMGNYAMHADLTTTLEDPELIDIMSNMSTHALGTVEARYKNKLNLGFDVAISAEVGLCLDKYFPASALEYGDGSNRRAISYRVGAFVDYGVMNINKNEPKEILANYPGLESLGDGKFSVPFNNLSTVQNNSIVSLQNSETGKVSALNSLVVGAKFTVLLGIDKAPKPVKKKPRRRPAVREVSFIPDPTYFYLFVNDFETDEPLDALVKVFTLGESQLFNFTFLIAGLVLAWIIFYYIFGFFFYSKLHISHLMEYLTAKEKEYIEEEHIEPNPAEEGLFEEDEPVVEEKKPEEEPVKEEEKPLCL